MRVRRTISAVAVVAIVAMGVTLLGVPPDAAAQSRGNIRLTGKVVDEAGSPVADAQVRAAKKGEAEPKTLNTKTNSKGEYTLNNLTAGEWIIEAAKDGVGITDVTTTLVESERTKTVDITIGKPEPPAKDPNAELQEEHQRGLQLAQSGKVAEARQVYEGLITKYPNVYQLHAMLGNLYAAEANPTKALEHINLALEKEPANVDWLLLKAEILMEKGDKDEAQKLLESVDMTKAKEARPFINLAINHINNGKHDEAIDLLTKLQVQFPNDTSILYYRGRAYIAATKLTEAKADLEKYVASAPPEAPQLADAKKLLEQLNKK